jgi:hypothetical protein
VTHAAASEDFSCRDVTAVSHGDSRDDIEAEDSIRDTTSV